MTEFQKLVVEIGMDWKVVHPWALPYYHAMLTMRSVGEKYGLDDGTDVVNRFLVNAATWRGDTARRVKARLKQMVKEAK